MSVSNADPWQVKNNSIEIENTTNIENTEIQEHSKSDSFEDNFATPDKLETQLVFNNNSNKNSDEIVPPHEPLPDSANYLQLLERKLAKVQKGNKLLDSLQEKREDCMRRLITSSVPATTIDTLIELDTPLESGRLQRHLLPVQAVTIGETLHIVKHDELEQQTKDLEQQTD